MKLGKHVGIWLSAIFVAGLWLVGVPSKSAISLGQDSRTPVPKIRREAFDTGTDCPWCEAWNESPESAGFPLGIVGEPNVLLGESLQSAVSTPTPVSRPAVMLEEMVPQRTGSVISFPWHPDEIIYDGAQLCDEQRAPDIAVDANGNAYALWADCRNLNGDNNWDIYFAYRPAGGTWSVNVKVNDDTGIAYQGSPSIAVDSHGNAYAVWEDSRNGDSDIYFAYRPAGGVWGTNVKVNDDTGLISQEAPSIAVDSQGNAYAVWVDYRNGDGDIYFAYRPVGGSWEPNVRVNDDSVAASQRNPSVAVDGSGNVYAVWEDYRNSNGDIYFAYRPAGGAWGSNVKVNDDAGSVQQDEPQIAVDSAGNAFAIWRDGRSNQGTDIYFAYRPVGGTWGTNVKINDVSGWLGHSSPDIAVDGAGNAYAVWQDWRAGLDVYFAYRPVGGSWGNNVQVAGPADQWSPSIAVDDSGNVYAVWRDGSYSDRSGDIYFASRPAAGVWGTGMQINDDAGSAAQSTPDIAVDDAGNAYAVWTDKRNDDGDIYFAYRPVGGSWGSAVRVNDDTGNAKQYAPALAVGQDGTVYVLWVDERDGDFSVYFAYRDTNGNWSANVEVTDAHNCSISSAETDVAVDANGNVYAIWADCRNPGGTDIYFAYRPAGGVWGTNVKVSDDSSDAWQDSPRIAVDNNGNAYAVWADGRNALVEWDNVDIYFAYRPANSVWSANVKVNDDSSNARQDHPSIAIDGNGNAYAVWMDRRDGGNGSIYFSYRPSSGLWGNNVRIDDATWPSSDTPDIAVNDNRDAYAVWVQSQEIYYSYRPSGGRWGVSVKVNDIGARWALTPHIAVDGMGNAYVVWEDRRNITSHIYFSYAQHNDIANGPPTGIAVNTTSDVADGNTASFADLLWNPGPDGKISLREALLAANNMTGTKTITFTIPTSDPGYDPVAHVWTIRPQSALPNLSSGHITIDATTQGMSVYGGPAVELDGTTAGSNGFTVTSGYNTIRGFVINRFSGMGIALSGSTAVSNTIAANYIGTDVAGQAELSNQQHGIVNQFGASYNRIGGPNPEDRNVISGNNWHGIENWGNGTSHNVVQGNYIGVDASGTQPLGNHGNGVSITPAAHDILVVNNVIAFNGTYGVGVGDNEEVKHNTISRNRIYKNGNSGIHIASASNESIQPPTIVSVTATSLAGIACPNCTIEIFSDEEDEGHYYEGTVTADASGAWNWSGVPTLPRFTTTATDAAGNTSEFSRVAVFVPNRPWSANERVDDGQRGCDQWLPTAVMDASGNVYAAWQDCRDGRGGIYFSRWDGTQWSTPVRIDRHPDANGTRPSLALNQSGTLYLVWEDWRLGPNNIYFARSTDGGVTWNPAIPITAEYRNRYSPQVAVDPAGRVYVTWYQYTSSWPASDIYVSTSTDDGNTWTAAVRVTDDTTTNSYQSSPTIVAVAPGHAVITWQDRRDGPTHVYASTTTDGGATWGTNARVDDDPGTQDKYAPTIAATPNGHIHIAWADYRNGNADIYMATSADGGITWRTNVRVDDGPGSADQTTPHLLATSDGKLWAIWQDRRASEHARVAASTDDGAHWSSSVQVDDSAPDVSVVQPVLAGSDGTTLHALWLDFRQGNYDVRAARSLTAGATWESSVQVSPDDSGTAAQYDIRLAVDPQGNVVAVWVDWPGHSGSRLYASTRPFTGTWGSNVRIDAADDLQLAPDLVTDGTGTWYVAWYDYRNGDSDIFMARSTDQGRTWSGGIKVNEDTGNSQSNPHLALDTGGVLYAAWNDARNGLNIYVASSQDQGQTWSVSQPITLTRGVSFYNSQWDLAAGDPGHLYLVWQQNSAIWFTESMDGGKTWASAHQIVANAGVDSHRYPVIAVAPDGTVHVAWYDYRNESDSDILYTYRDTAGVWYPHERVDDSTAAQFRPHLAVDDAGNVYLIWSDARNDDGDIYYAYRPVGGTWGPNKKVDDVALSWQSGAQIATDEQGRLYAIWYDRRLGPAHPYFAWRYSPAPYDLNKNGQVDLGDVQSEAAHWRQSKNHPDWDPRFDMDSDGKITILDILRIASQME